MTDNKRATVTRRTFLGGTAMLGATGFVPVVAAQDEAPVIEPVGSDPESTQAPIEPDAQQSNGEIEQIESTAEEQAGQYFAETGHNVSEPFLAPWRQAGGADVLGMPLSEAHFVAATGLVDQFFEGIVLVSDPTLATSWSEHGQSLGERRIADAAPASARNPVSGCTAGDGSCQFFPDTGHTISGDIAAFWQQGGGQPIFGLPRSEPFSSGGGTKQVFENVILNASASGEITAEAVGEDIVQERGLENAAAFLPAPPTLGTSTLVSASEGLRLRSAPSTDGEIVAVLPDNAEFVAVSSASGEWIPGFADGYSGYAASTWLEHRDAVPEPGVGGEWNASVWQGVALAETNLRKGPSTARRIVTTIQYGDPVTVADWVQGQRVDGGTDTWAQLDDGTYMYERNVGRAGPVQPTPVPNDAPAQGRWIDCDLTQQLMVAYEGRRSVRVCVTTTGKPGFETPTGLFYINTRIANETMESGSIGAAEFYRLENVLYTQYFTDVGHALHYAWWKSEETIGKPGSHGCLNLLLDDSEFFWNWAGIGTPVYCHY